uniref:Zinc finger protein n=1 Tax=Syphacia muris TaxID=451379 RepID=A0A0N5AZB5_9BILA
MEVHQSLPTHYLPSSYIVKPEQPPSAPSTPPIDDVPHTVNQAHLNPSSVTSMSSCSTDHRLYGHDSNPATIASQASPAIQNGRTLTADRKRPYNCTTCSSRFGSKMELEEHQNSHTGQKPFECNMCKARFNRRSTLWNHKRIHSDDKPFECNVCRMTFKWKNSLKCHKEMHQRKNEITGFENDPNEKTLTYATAAKKRMLESHDVGGIPTSSTEILQNGGPLITTCAATKKRSSKSLMNARALPAATPTNGVFGNNALSAVDGLLHPQLQAVHAALTRISSYFQYINYTDALQSLQDGFFANPKSVPIKDSKELDSLLSSTSRFSSIFKDDNTLKPNLCDDLTGFNTVNNVFDTKQEMSLFHPNAYLMLGTHQLQPSVSNFAQANLSSLNPNANSCGDYFHMQNGQTDQMTIGQTQQLLPMQTQYSQAGMLMNHNVITYQSNVSFFPMLFMLQMEAPALINSSAGDYTMTPTGLEYVLGNYQQSSTTNELGLDNREADPLQYSAAAQQQQTGATDDANTSKVVPQVSW